MLAGRNGVRLKLKNDSTPIALNADEELIKRMVLNSWLIFADEFLLTLWQSTGRLRWSHIKLSFRCSNT